MTPAETLRAAADRLDALDKAATPGPWTHAGVGYVEAADGFLVSRSAWAPGSPDAELIAATRPLVPLLARMLRWEAGCVETAGATPNLLDLAAAVLGSPAGVPRPGQGDPS